MDITTNFGDNFRNFELKYSSTMSLFAIIKTWEIFKDDKNYSDADKIRDIVGSETINKRQEILSSLLFNNIAEIQDIISEFSEIKERLIKIYKENAVQNELDELEIYVNNVEKYFTKNKIYKCPKCDGSGKVGENDV